MEHMNFVDIYIVFSMLGHTVSYDLIVYIITFDKFVYDYYTHKRQALLPQAKASPLRNNNLNIPLLAMTSPPEFSGSGEETATPGLYTMAFSFLPVILSLVVISYPIYALYLHPLSSYPGPKLCAITRIPYWVACLKGDQVKWMSKLHREYGPVVRFGPDDLSYTDGRAWRDICLVPKGRKENGKEVKFHAPPANGVSNLIAQPDAVHHAAVRRVFAPAFSEKALTAQEPLLQKYADLMIARSREATEVNMTQLFNFTTFDIMADFAFGESLHLLEKNEYSPWLATVFNTVKVCQC